jgi:SHS2 domain-containing protein
VEVDLSGQSSPSWEFFDHAADVGIRLQASTLELLFVAAGQALMEWIGPAPENSVPCHEEIHVEGENHEELMVRWLQELLYFFHQRQLYFLDAPAIRISPTSLECRIKALNWSAAQYELFQEVKAVTYHRLRVVQEGSVWRATVILDV